MIHTEVSIEVPRPPGEVFAFLNDFAAYPRWMGQCTALEQTSAASRCAGSTLRYAYKQGGHTGQMSGVVTEFKSGHFLTMQFSDKAFRVTVLFRVEPSGSGSRITHAVDIETHSLLSRLMAPLIRAGSRSQVAKDAAKLKALLSAEAR